MSKRLIYIAFSIVLLLSLAFLSLPARTAGHIKLAIGGLFFPLFGLANTSQQLANKAANTLISRQTLLNQNDQLRRENQTLQIQALQGAEALRENDRLRDALGWIKQTPWKAKLAHVIGRDPANWWHSIQIDLGSRDGIHANMTVLTPQGLVGRTAEVSLGRTLVVLVGDPNCRVAAKVLEARDCTGVIFPNSSDPADNTVVDLNYLARTAPIKPGQKVVTSGHGGVYPPGIPLGEIIDTRVVEYGISLEARVKLAANFNQLEEVFVLCQ